MKTISKIVNKTGSISSFEKAHGIEKTLNCYKKDLVRKHSKKVM